VFKSSRTVILSSAIGIALAATLTGCAASSPSSTDSRLRIVASTDVWGDIASQVGGRYVTVDSIIDDPSKDPHEYEADAQNQLSVSKADVVVENGGGYDDFIDTLLKAANNDDAVVVNAADSSGYDQDPVKGEFNEHLWYDFPTVGAVADELAATLSKLDPAHSSEFAANAKAFTAKLTDLETQEASVKTTAAGLGVAITEPVPLYLLDAMGFVNKTPPAFSEAVEEDTDVPADVLRDTLALFSEKSVVLLAYNEQTAGATTDQLLKQAKSNGIPTVAVRETLPAGQGYLEWMQSDIDAITAAIAQ
jgi:zinc/manganese transport system substrate-binding protein